MSSEKLRKYIDNTPYSELKKLYQPGKKIYFVGIGGISMRGLAELAAAHGLNVAGSDMQSFTRQADMIERKITTYIGQCTENIAAFQPDMVVYTLAIKSDNPELLYARKHGIPTLERAEFLGLINRLHKCVINIAGTNGKSTTTTLCGLMLEASNLDPTIHVGAEIKEFGSTVRAGNLQMMVSEACEFGRSFLHFHSTTAVVLNIDHDHVDCYATLEDVIDVFSQFVANMEPGSTLIYPLFDRHIPSMLARVEEIAPGLIEQLRVLTFDHGSNSDRKADLVCRDLEFIEGYPHFKLCFQGEELGAFSLRMPGVYNVDNAMAAMLAALANGCDPEMCRSVMRNYTGPGGRFTELGTINGARVVADYAHHPESVRLASEAAEQFPHQRLFLILEPIITSRAELLCEGFVDALKKYPHVLVTEVYDNREMTHKFSTRVIAEKINKEGGNACYLADYPTIKEHLKSVLKPGDICLVMGTLTLHEALTKILD